MLKTIKYIIFFLLVCNIQVVRPQSTILFSESGLQLALDKAKKDNKPVLLWCYATWCPHCKYMKGEVFTNRTVADFYNKTFICVSQDMEKGEGPELNKDIKVNSYPTFVYYDPNGTMVYRMEGEFNSMAFVAEGKNSQMPKKQLPWLKLQFEKDVSNSNNCYDYLRALKKGGMDLSSVVSQYFATQTAKQLLSEVNWRIFTNGVSDFNSREFKFVIGHQKEFANIASPERVNRKLKYEVKSLLNPLVESTDTINYLLKRELAVQIHSFSTDSLIFNYDLKIWELTHNWKKYNQICLPSVETFVWKNHTHLSEIASNFLKNIADSTALQQAARWAQRSLDLDKSYDNYILCSKLYQKLNNSALSIKMATKARDMAMKFGWQGTEAEKLLNELNDTSK